MPIRILLVEDHTATRRVLAKMLARRGYEITEAGSGATALKAVQGCKFDLLVSDVGLPDMRGWELMVEAKKICPHLPGIALSGFGMVEDVTASERAGFNLHLTKPATAQQIDAAIQKVLGRGLEPAD